MGGGERGTGASYIWVMSTGIISFINEWQHNVRQWDRVAKEMREYNADAQRRLERLRKEVIAVHLHYVGLVVRSKAAELLGRVPTDYEIRQHAVEIYSTQAPGARCIVWDGVPMIHYKVNMRLDDLSVFKPYAYQIPAT